MNICHVITRLIIGGAQENTILTCRGLVERGHRVTLIAGPETGPEGSLWDQASGAGCELITVKPLRRAVRPISDWAAHRRLKRLFERLRPDVVHTHSSKAGILGRSAAARAGVPVIIHTIHGMSFNRTQPAHVRMFYRWLERRAARCTTALVTVADAMIDQAVAAGIAPRDRFATIRSGIETNRFAPRAELRDRHRREWGIAADEIVVGTMARLFENKGYEEIISAMLAAVASEPRLKFVWIGDGAHRARYERRLKAIGLRDRVHMVGLIDPDKVASYINGFDIVLHASRWEGLPRVVVQGLLTEVPAISFDNDGAPEVVIPNETGILVPFGDTERLAQAIVTLARDAGLRRTLGRLGRAHCAAMFDWHRMVTDLESLYEKGSLDREPG
ncbi:MAG: glycosyltransferase family 4 protein [Phycisphaerae bacterium]